MRVTTQRLLKLWGGIGLFSKQFQSVVSEDWRGERGNVGGLRSCETTTTQTAAPEYREQRQKSERGVPNGNGRGRKDGRRNLTDERRLACRVSLLRTEKRLCDAKEDTASECKKDVPSAPRIADGSLILKKQATTATI